MLEQQVVENAGEAATTHASQGFDQPLEGFDTLFPVAPPPRGEQGVLFTDPVSVTDLVVPTVRGASGSGTQRLYSFRDVLVLKIVKRLLDTGVSLQQIRTSIEHLRTRGIDDLANITLMSDGTTVYECTSPSEVIDLVQAGQGVFGIAIGRVWREIEMNLNGQPGEEMHENFEGDELAARRARRAQA